MASIFAVSKVRASISYLPPTSWVGLAHWTTGSCLAPSPLANCTLPLLSFSSKCLPHPHQSLIAPIESPRCRKFGPPSTYGVRDRGIASACLWITPMPHIRIRPLSGWMKWFDCANSLSCLVWRIWWGRPLWAPPMLRSTLEVVSIAMPLPYPLVRTGIGEGGWHRWMLHWSWRSHIPPEILRGVDWDLPSGSHQIETAGPLKSMPTWARNCWPQLAG